MIKFLVWFPIFFLPSFQLARVTVGIPAPNTLLLLLPLSLGFIKVLKPTKSSIALILSSFIITIHGLYYEVLSPICVALIVTPIIYIIANNYKFTSLKTLPRIICTVSILNFLLCLIQLRYPTLGLSNTNINYDISDFGSSALELYLPFIPSLGRLRGIFNENGPMMLYLLVYTTFLAKFLSFIRSSSALWLGFHDKFFIYSAIACNVFVILFTGSKTIILALPILFLVAVSTTNSLLPQKSNSLRLMVSRNPGASFLCIYLLVFIMVNFLPSLVDYLISQFFTGLIGIEMRLATDSLRFSYLSAEGLLPSSEGSNLAGSLSAYHIYTYAFGSIIASFLISAYIFFILRITNSLMYVILVLLAFLVSGSLMIPFYTQMVILCSFPPSQYAIDRRGSRKALLSYNA